MNHLILGIALTVSGVALTILWAISPTHARDAIRATAAVSAIALTLALTIHTTRS